MKSDMASPIPVVRSFITQKITVISGTLVSRRLGDRPGSDRRADESPADEYLVWTLVILSSVPERSNLRPAWGPTTTQRLIFTTDGSS